MSVGRQLLIGFALLLSALSVSVGASAQAEDDPLGLEGLWLTPFVTTDGPGTRDRFENVRVNVEWDGAAGRYELRLAVNAILEPDVCNIELPEDSLIGNIARGPSGWLISSTISAAWRYSDFRTPTGGPKYCVRDTVTGPLRTPDDGGAPYPISVPEGSRGFGTHTASSNGVRRCSESPPPPPFARAPDLRDWSWSCSIRSSQFVLFEDRTDTDGDGLPDEWEKHPLRIGGQRLDLKAMGADPRHKDVFVELDRTGGSTSYSPDVMRLVQRAFANSPVPNPDGSPGIDLHIDGGPNYTMDLREGTTWGEKSKAGSADDLPTLPRRFGSVSPDTGTCTGDEVYDWRPFDDVKRAHFARSRGAAFRYVLVVPTIGEFQCGLGLSRNIPQVDAVVTDQWRPFGNPEGAYVPYPALRHGNTFMHEFGHLLGLLHGGDEEQPFKPNYLSVMSYLTSATGGITSPSGTTELRFSATAPTPANTLDEERLDEAVGIPRAAYDGSPPVGATHVLCPSSTPGGRPTQPPVPLGEPADLNCNGAIEPGTVAYDLDASGPLTAGGTALGPVRTFDDWSHLVYAPPPIGRTPAGAARAATADRLATTRVGETLSFADVQADAAAQLGDTAPPTITVTKLGGGRRVKLSARDEAGVADLVIKVGKGPPRSVRQGIAIAKGTAGFRPAPRTLTATVTLPRRGRVVAFAADQVGRVSPAKTVRRR